MEVCKTDIKNIIQFLEESAALITVEVCRRNKLGIGTLRLENRARLMRLMAKKLDKKLKSSIKESNNEKGNQDFGRECAERL